MAAEFLHKPLTEQMPRTADAVIIGGGPAGSTVAWALEQKQPGFKTVLIEQGDQLGSGASKASIENFRTCWPQESLMAMMSYSFEIFTHPDDYLGPGAARALNVKQRGYL